MNASELMEWMAYDRMEPFGETRADLRMAIQASTMVNMWKGRNSRRAKPADFMPQFDRRSSGLRDARAIQAMFKMMAKVSKRRR